MLHRPGIFTPERAAELGIARVSIGSLLYRLALGAMLQGADELNPRLSVGDVGRTPTYAPASAVVVTRGRRIGQRNARRPRKPGPSASSPDWTRTSNPSS